MLQASCQQDLSLRFVGYNIYIYLIHTFEDSSQLQTKKDLNIVKIKQESSNITCIRCKYTVLVATVVILLLIMYVFRFQEDTPHRLYIIFHILEKNPVFLFV